MRLGDFSHSELIAAFAALVGIPFYLGFVHFSGVQLLLYSGVAETGMAAGEYLEADPALRGSWKCFVQGACNSTLIYYYTAPCVDRRLENGSTSRRWKGSTISRDFPPSRSRIATGPSHPSFCGL